MALIVETGDGVYGAQTYAATVWITAYYTARPNHPQAAVWAALTDANKDGANVMATDYLDAVFGPFYRGRRRGFVQGLLFPRSEALDEAGYPLQDLPDCLRVAVAELAPRASQGPLQADINTGTRVRAVTKKIGPLETSTEYFDAGVQAPKVIYGVLNEILAPILDGSQPGAPNQKWAWG